MGWETQPLPCQRDSADRSAGHQLRLRAPGGREQEDPAEPQARARGQPKRMPTSRMCRAPYLRAAAMKARCEQLRQPTARQRHGAWGGAGDHLCLPGAGPPAGGGGGVSPQDLIPQSPVQTAPHACPLTSAPSNIPAGVGGRACLGALSAWRSPSQDTGRLGRGWRSWTTCLPLMPVPMATTQPSQWLIVCRRLPDAQGEGRPQHRPNLPGCSGADTCPQAAHWRHKGEPKGHEVGWALGPSLRSHQRAGAAAGRGRFSYTCGPGGSAGEFRGLKEG